MDSFVVTVTICMLQIASFGLNTEGVTKLGLAIWLLGDLLGMLYSWWTFCSMQVLHWTVLLSQ